MVYNVMIAVSLLVAIVFSALVFITGKGDAMGGSSGVRTTFKGKASFEDYMSKAALYAGITWMVLMLLTDIVSNRMKL